MQVVSPYILRSRLCKLNLGAQDLTLDKVEGSGKSQMEMRTQSSGRCLCGTAKPAAAVQQKHNLYLVLDDWDKGYSIYRVSEEDFVVSDADADADDKNSPRQQADSPLVRIKAYQCAWFVAGHETKIFAMNPAKSSPGIPVLDTATLSMTVCPNTYSRGDHGQRPVYASVGDRFLCFSYPFVDVLGPEPAALSGAWSWTTIEHDQPFDSTSVGGYAVHPDGRTVFMSVWGYNPDVSPARIHGDRCSTYAFDMERLDWTYLGEWALPFRGQAHYDRELDAWVGICWYKQDGAAGRVCCCDVPPDAEPRDTVPTWRLGVDVLFRPDDLHFGAKLVYKGDSNFCLVESRRRVHDDHDGRYFRDVKMTSFALKYDKLGDLRTTRRRGYASLWYQSHKGGNPADDPVAFWM